MPNDNFTEVTADLWDEMTVNQLYEQMSVLQSRSQTAYGMGNLPMYNQILAGITRLEEIIKSKTKDDSSVTVQ